MVSNKHRQVHGDLTRVDYGYLTINIFLLQPLNEIHDKASERQGQGLVSTQALLEEITCRL